MKGIPTYYKYRKYRSRLEARWACTFDLFGWKFEYEPFDLDGWIPDFIIYGVEQELIVEVKPFSKLKEFDTNKVIKGIKKYKQGTEILLLGSTIFKQDEYFQSAYIGWLGEYNGKEYDFGEAVINFYERKWGIIHSYGFYKDRITSLYRGNDYIDTPNFNKVLYIWNRAGNITQWK